MPRQLIIEADGGSRGNPGIAAGGAVVIDGETQQVLASVGVYVGIATNNVAEYNGLLAGLIKAYDIDPGALVHVRMDSKLVVEQMSGRWKIKHPDMRELALAARDIFPPGQVTYVKDLQYIETPDRLFQQLVSETIRRTTSRASPRFQASSGPAGRMARAWMSVCIISPRAAYTARWRASGALPMKASLVIRTVK